MPPLEHKELKRIDSKKTYIILNKSLRRFFNLWNWMTKELCSREWHIIALTRQWHFKINTMSILLHVISIRYRQSTDWCRYWYPQNLRNANILNTTIRYLGKYVNMNESSNNLYQSKTYCSSVISSPYISFCSKCFFFRQASLMTSWHGTAFGISVPLCRKFSCGVP